MKMKSTIRLTLSFPSAAPIPKLSEKSAPRLTLSISSPRPDSKVKRIAVSSLKFFSTSCVTNPARTVTVHVNSVDAGCENVGEGRKIQIYVIWRQATYCHCDVAARSLTDIFGTGAGRRIDMKYYGKEKCRILKQIRAEIARNNDIEYVIEDCPHQGDCRGTCPKCEAEVRELENKLAARRRIGKKVIVAGVAAGISLGVAGACTPDKPVYDGLMADSEQSEVSVTTPLPGDNDGNGQIYGNGDGTDTVIYPTDLIMGDYVILPDDADPAGDKAGTSGDDADPAGDDVGSAGSVEEVPMGMMAPDYEGE